MDVKLIGDKTKDLGVGIAYLKETTDNREIWAFTKSSAEVLQIMADASKEFIVAETIKDAVEQLETTNPAPEGFSKINGVSNGERGYVSPEFSIDDLSPDISQGLISILTDNTIRYKGKLLNGEGVEPEDVFAQADRYDKVYIFPGVAEYLSDKSAHSNYRGFSANFVETIRDNYVVKTFRAKVGSKYCYKNIFAYVEFNPKRAKSLTTRRKNYKVKKNPWYNDYTNIKILNAVDDSIETLVFKQYPILVDNMNFNHVKTVDRFPQGNFESDQSGIWYNQLSSWRCLEIAVALKCTRALRKSKELKENIKAWFSLLDSIEFREDWVVPEYIVWPLITRIQEIFKWNKKKLPVIYKRYLEEKVILDRAAEESCKAKEEECKRLVAQEAKDNAEIAAIKEEVVNNVENLKSS